MPDSAQIKRKEENTMKLHSNSESRRPMRAMSSRRTAGIIRQCVAVVLVGALLGLCSPVLAGDFVPQKFNVPPAGLGVTLGLRSISSEPELPGPSTRVGLASTNAAFSIQYPAQQQPAQPTYQPPPQRHWTTAGKVLTFVGLGLVVSGVLTAALGNQQITACSSYSGNCASTSINWKPIGGGIAATGGALMIIGLTRRGD